MTYIDTRHVSALLKRELIAAFPGVKFSVRKGALSLSVSWTDGPASDAVEDIARAMKGSTWSPMDSCYKKTGNLVTVVIDGQEVTGEPLVDHVSTHRTVSDDARAEAVALWSAEHGGAEPTGMKASFVCGGLAIRDGVADTQVTQIANDVVLPRRWAAHQKAAAAKAPAKKAAPARAKASPAAAPTSAAAPAPAAPTVHVIAHSDERGIHVTGTRRRDGFARTLRDLGFDWHRKPKFWFIPGTEGPDGAACLDEVRTALQQAGMTFADDQPAPAAEEPAAVVEVAELVDELPAVVPPAQAPAARRLRSVPRPTSYEDTVMGDLREYISDAPGIGVRTAAASTAVIGRKVRTGVIREDHLTGTLAAATAAVTAKAVREMRAQGLTHEQIKQRLERKRAEAQHARSVARVAVADAMIAAHAGIVADEEAAALAAVADQAPPPALAPVKNAPQLEPPMLAGPGIEAGPHRIVNTGEYVDGPGSAYAFACLNDCGVRARLVEFDGLRCTGPAMLTYAAERATGLLDDVTLRDAERFGVELRPAALALPGFPDDAPRETGEGGVTDWCDRQQARRRLTTLLRTDATHRWYRGELRLLLDGAHLASFRPVAAEAPAEEDTPAAPADYRSVPVPADIAEAWEQPTGAAWRAGVDGALAAPLTRARTL
ncbi:LPD29 domain-containing protein [[Kitasatospora] papulosa]|uniref:LPD29 domain-containing protein n=1 Tax=[Kitasatospora] papulosa TaxID=1464011 RepID=UPI0036C5CABF